MSDDAIVWKSIFLNGHEYCRVLHDASFNFLVGSAIFSKDQRPTRLDYSIKCDSHWRSLSAEVSGWLGDEQVDLQIFVKDGRFWFLNGEEQKELEGCVDVDLNFSPSTNLLPIRRLNLRVGEVAEVKAGWLRFPSFKLEPLRQSYRRIDETTYRYESGGGTFGKDLRVNPMGLVTSYPDIWEVER
ncbi:MAG TPA: putative glycolipid-binding domain-containing protein [Pyrinomonadaceae bacterium]|nr:putative glycolipid-binding domain-containing protein [Pyrinomonadaceae bacterium]